MSTFRRFEEIEAWKKARELTKEIYRSTESGRFSRDFGLKDQIRRAAVSAMSNIAEGFERGGNREFVQFLSVTKGSLGEVRSLLWVAFDQQYLDQGAFEAVTVMASSTARRIAALITYLMRSNRKGFKFTGQKP